MQPASIGRIKPMLRDLLNSRPMALWPEAVKGGDPAKVDRWLSTFAGDLAEFPTWAVEHALSEWRRMPTPYLPYQVGQLLPCIKAATAKAEYLRNLLPKPETARNHQNREKAA
jgi:hypothetical protein